MRDKEDSAFIENLYANAAYSQKPVMHAVEETLSIYEGSKNMLVMLFSKALKRIKNGEEVSVAFSSELDSARISEILRLRILEMSKSNDLGTLIEELHRIADEEEAERIEIGFGSLQKYLAVSILVGTILPSLTLFGYVGYSMLYGSGSIFIAFAFALMVLFPSILILVKKHIGDIYEEG